MSAAKELSAGSSASLVHASSSQPESDVLAAKASPRRGSDVALDLRTPPRVVTQSQPQPPRESKQELRRNSVAEPQQALPDLGNRVYDHEAGDARLDAEQSQGAAAPDYVPPGYRMPADLELATLLPNMSDEEKLLFADIQKSLFHDIDADYAHASISRQVLWTLQCSLWGAFRDFIAQGVGQAVGNAIEQALKRIEQGDGPAPLTMASVSAFAAEFLVLGFIEKAAVVLADALKVESPRIRYAIQGAPTVAYILMGALGGAPMLGLLLRQKLAYRIRDAGSQLPTGYLPRIVQVMPDEHGRMVELPADLQRRLDNRRSTWACVPYGIYCFFHKRIEAYMLHGLTHLNAEPSEQASLREAMLGKTGIIVSKATLEGVDILRHPLLQLLQMLIRGGEVRLVPGSYKSWKEELQTFFERYSNGTGMREGNGLFVQAIGHTIGEDSHLARRSPGWSMAARVISASANGYTAARSRVVALGLLNRAERDRVQGELRNDGVSADFHPKLSAPPGDQFAHDRAKAGLHPLGTLMAVRGSGILVTVVSSKDDFDSKKESINVASAHGMELLSQLQRAYVPILAVNYTESGSYANITIPRDRVERHFVRADDKAAARPSADELRPPRVEFVPSSSFHLEGILCTVQRADEAGENFITFSSLSPLDAEQYPPFIPAARVVENGVARITPAIYRMAESALRAKKVMPLRPLATRELHRGAVVIIGGVGCSVEQYYQALGEEIPRLVLASRQPIPVVDKDVHPFTDHGLHGCLMTEMVFRKLEPVTFVDGSFALNGEPFIVALDRHGNTTFTSETPRLNNELQGYVDRSIADDARTTYVVEPRRRSHQRMQALANEVARQSAQRSQSAALDHKAGPAAARHDSKSAAGSSQAQRPRRSAPAGWDDAFNRYKIQIQLAIANGIDAVSLSKVSPAAFLLAQGSAVTQHDAEQLGEYLGMMWLGARGAAADAIDLWVRASFGLDDGGLPPQGAPLAIRAAASGYIDLKNGSADL